MVPCQAQGSSSLSTGLQWPKLCPGCHITVRAAASSAACSELPASCVTWGPHGDTGQDTASLPITTETPQPPPRPLLARRRKGQTWHCHLCAHGPCSRALCHLPAPHSVPVPPQCHTQHMGKEGATSSVIPRLDPCPRWGLETPVWPMSPILDFYWGQHCAPSVTASVPAPHGGATHPWRRLLAFPAGRRSVGRGRY